jgi:hypothetical protein
MMNVVRRYIILLSAIVASYLALRPQPASSQFESNCPMLIQRAVERVEEICSGTGRNQVCYANSWTRAEPQAFVTDFSFELGDITDVANIRSLELGELNVRTDDWGMVLMRVQANLPASLPGQNVMYLLFGDINFAIDHRPDVASPMQAVRLETRVGGPDCDDAPPNGLLVQTPHGVGRVLLRINGVDVSLGSTVFFTAQPNAYLNISTIEGSALVHAEGKWSAALPGTQVRVPMSADMEPAGPPSLPEAYVFEEMVTLPISTLQRPVVVQPPLDEPQLQTLQQQVHDGVLPEVGQLAAQSLDLTQSSLDYLTTTLDDVDDVVTGVVGEVGELTTEVTTAVQTTVDTAASAVTTTLDTVGETVGAALPEPVANTVNAVTDAAGDAVTVVTDTAVDAVGTTTETVVNGAGTVVETVTTVAGDVVDGAGQVVEDVVDTVQQILPLPALPRLFGR